jgi:PhoPQ-activated pathogenicity-related protein
VLGQIPNQPLGFADEGYAPRREDALVAYSWDRAMNQLDWQWPAYLPMTKASVRAMDSIQDMASNLPVPPVNRFVVSGFSKRGATTWLTGAVDPRVRAIAPGVFDVLDIDKQIEHHFSAYGFYSSAISDYEDYNLLRRLRTPEGQDLLEVIDPLSYRDRLDMPKFLLNSPGDQFFLPDSARFYFDQLPGEKLIRYVANTDHGLETAPGDVEDALVSLLGWYLSILYEQPRPNISWAHDNGQLIVTTDQTPLVVRFWQAHNPDGRDFRLETIGRSWQPLPVPAVAAGTYAVPVPQPSSGWTAYYVDLIYPGVADVPQTYSTAVFVSPDTLPYSVTDALLDPRGVGYWKHQFQAALTGNGKAQVSVEELTSYLPTPLFDESVDSLERAAEILDGYQHRATDKAKRECLALRLNVRNQQIGWYTHINLYQNTEKKLWEYYAEAHDAYLAGNTKHAKAICTAVNQL